MPDDAPADTPQPYAQPYLVRQPDGSVATYTLRANQQPTVGEIADYAESQGQEFAGFPEGPNAPPRPPAESPPPQLSAAPPPTFGEQASQTFFPRGPLMGSRRSFMSQVPSMGLGAGGAWGGAALGALAPPPFDLITIPLGAVAGAALGGGAGEAAQYGGEQLVGAQPAEPGTLGERVRGAAIRTGTTEGLAQTISLPAHVIAQRAMPVAEGAAGELAPVFEQSLPADVQTVQDVAGRVYNIDRLLNDPVELGTKFRGPPGTQDTLLRAWWQRMADQPAKNIVEAWDKLGTSGQIALAGRARRDAMQGVIDNYAATLSPITRSELAWSGGLAGTGGVSYFMAHPGAAALAPTLAAKAAAESSLVPWLTGGLIRTPGGASWLATLPRAAQVAPPIWHAGVQAVAAPYAPTGLASSANGG